MPVKPPCRACGERPESGRSPRHLCSVCVPWHCQRCGEKLDKPKAGRHCTACQQRRHEIDFQRTDRKCYLCQKPLAVGYRQSRCSECRHEIYEGDVRAMLAKGPRPCRDCGETMPHGRINSRCTDCSRIYRAAHRCQAPCARCGVRARVKSMSYCTVCNSTRSAWAKAYYQGDPAARMIRQIKPRRKLQAREDR